MQIVDVFRARIVDITNDSFIIEITGDEEKIEGFVEVLRPYGIIEMARTGVVAMARGASPVPGPEQWQKQQRLSFRGFAG